MTDLGALFVAAIASAFLSFQPTKELVGEAVERAAAYQQLEGKRDRIGQYQSLSSAYRAIVSFAGFRAEEDQFASETGKPLLLRAKTVHFLSAGPNAGGSSIAIKAELAVTYERKSCVEVFTLVKEVDHLVINRVERTCMPTSHQ